MLHWCLGGSDGSYWSKLQAPQVMRYIPELAATSTPEWTELRFMKTGLRLLTPL